MTVDESVAWDIASQIGLLRDAGQEPAEIRVSRYVRHQMQSEIGTGFVAPAPLRRVPVVLVEGAALDYWAVLPMPMVGAD